MVTPDGNGVGISWLFTKARDLYIKFLQKVYLILVTGGVFYILKVRLGAKLVWKVGNRECFRNTF